MSLNKLCVLNKTKLVLNLLSNIQNLKHIAVLEIVVLMLREFVSEQTRKTRVKLIPKHI
jgi:hypothetical protein